MSKKSDAYGGICMGLTVLEFKALPGGVLEVIGQLQGCSLTPTLFNLRWVAAFVT